ncbi:hypothetical protein GI374_07735 [Paracoccus sp. S-4012]|nr:hypothetical protein [Paracoccus sp. S-4012]MRX50341.1 hypothetical protein [Paracoccus sp. S-4012]
MARNPVQPERDPRERRPEEPRDDRIPGTEDDGPNPLDTPPRMPPD